MNRKAFIAFFLMTVLFVAGCERAENTGTVNGNGAANSNQSVINTNGAPQEKDGCVISGCSGQVCGAGEIISTCEYRPEYDCYKTATCAKQGSGRCDWTETEQLVSCLESKQKNTDNQKPTGY